MNWPMRFGVFLAPFNPVGQHPTIALEKDLELIEWMDRWNFDEAWIGEHHSGGYEIIASPEVFIGVASQRTRRIRLGTGVLSLPYHHPYMLAERMVLLDHLTRGRAMFGVGPGQLTSDAAMLGIDPNQQRRMMAESLDAIMALLRGDGPVTMETDWFRMIEARLHLRPYSHPHMEMAVAASISPAGPSAAGKHGLGLLSIASWSPAGFDVLGDHWEIVEEQAAAHGSTVDRRQWRMMGPMHLARSEAEARKHVESGFLRIFDYLAHLVPLPQLQASTYDELIDGFNASGGGVVGTPAMAVECIGKLIEQSRGGFGGYLLMGGELAGRGATLDSYQLFAEEVMPHFQGQLEPLQASHDWVRAAPSATPGVTRWLDATTTAIRNEIERYRRERESAQR
ncbi:MAG TPA: LLM class flavin-dependent oxidoreductase [Candidatus Dormibacteraeota bacterium]|nr:LLM class flavin-dependent oxidoreductase [Candidatus Dormibacteraeota bacterium]